MSHAGAGLLAEAADRLGLTGALSAALAAMRERLGGHDPEALNSRVRLISHRSFAFHSAAPLIALIYLCCGGITIDLPLR